MADFKNHLSQASLNFVPGKDSIDFSIAANDMNILNHDESKQTDQKYLVKKGKESTMNIDLIKGNKNSVNRLYGFEVDNTTQNSKGSNLFMHQSEIENFRSNLPEKAKLVVD